MMMLRCQMVVFRFPDDRAVTVPREVAVQAAFLAPFVDQEELSMAGEQVTAAQLELLLQEWEEMSKWQSLTARERQEREDADYEERRVLDREELGKWLTALKAADFLGMAELLAYLAYRVRHRFATAGPTAEVVVQEAQAAVAGLGVDLVATLRGINLGRTAFRSRGTLAEIVTASADLGQVLLQGGNGPMYEWHQRDAAGKYQLVMSFPAQEAFPRKPGPPTGPHETSYFFYRNQLYNICRGADGRAVIRCVQDDGELVVGTGRLCRFILKYDGRQVVIFALYQARSYMYEVDMQDQTVTSVERATVMLPEPYRQHVSAERGRSTRGIIQSPKYCWGLACDDPGTLQVRNYYTGQAIALRNPEFTRQWIEDTSVGTSVGDQVSYLTVTDEGLLLWACGKEVREFEIPTVDSGLSWDDGRVVCITEYPIFGIRAGTDGWLVLNFHPLFNFQGPPDPTIPHHMIYQRYREGIAFE